MATGYSRQARELARRVSAPWRALPAFVVIGAMKAGTTSLYAYLSDHPQVVPALRKEVHYFDVQHRRGEGWYRSMFPLRAQLRGGRVTGEASPYYLRHPSAPARCATLLPQARLLVLLRDPVERALSHWQHAHRLGHETLPFGPALAAERRRETGELPCDEATVRHLSYVGRGRYDEQLQAWLRHYPREQLLVCTSEQLFTEPARTYREVLAFLGLDPDHTPPFRAYNSGASTSGASGGLAIDPEVRADLEQTFAGPTRRLAELLGWQDPWPRR